MEETEIVAPMPVTSVRQIVVYSRPGCHLCEDASEILDQLARRIPMQIVRVNILDDVDLFERYKHSIPVVEVVGRATLIAPIRAADLERILI
jgi:hypothetical protein